MAELQGSDDTLDLSKVGMAIDPRPTTVLEEAGNGGYTRLNTPTGGTPRVSPEGDSPGLRGYYNDHDADDRNLP